MFQGAVVTLACLIAFWDTGRRSSDPGGGFDSVVKLVRGGIFRLEGSFGSEGDFRSDDGSFSERGANPGGEPGKSIQNRASAQGCGREGVSCA